MPDENGKCTNAEIAEAIWGEALKSHVTDEYIQATARMHAAMNGRSAPRLFSAKGVAVAIFLVVVINLIAYLATR